MIYKYKKYKPNIILTIIPLIKQNNIKDVLVEKTDRIYRNFKDYVVLEDYDLTIHLVKEGVVLNKNSRSHEKLVHGFKVLLAKNYLDNLSEEVRKGLEEKVAQGYYPQKAPVGYKNVVNENKKKIIVPDTASPLTDKNSNGMQYIMTNTILIIKDFFMIAFSFSSTAPDKIAAASITSSQMIHILSLAPLFALTQFFRSSAMK